MIMSIEEIKVNNNTIIKWYQEDDCYKVTVKTYNREIYNKLLDKKHFEIYYNYINERVKYLIDEEILNSNYCMILLDNTMYKVLDSFHFMDLCRFLAPVESSNYYDCKDVIFDLVTDCTLRTGEIFFTTDLVFHNGTFYNNGNVVKTIRDFDRVGVEYTEYDLLNGINEEQMKYLINDYYNRDFIRYVTREVINYL